MTLQSYEPPRDYSTLLDRATDSWTAVLVPVGDLASKIAGTDFVPKDLRGNPAKVAAAILHGRELGLPPMTALAGVHVVNGRPGISAELMRALIQQAGHELRVTETTSARCKMRGRRRGEDEWTEVTYSMDEATKAGDSKRNSNYQTRPADMLVARATTRLARILFADVIHGMRSIEELQDLVEGEIVDGPNVPQVDTVTVSRAPRAAVEGGPAPSEQGAAGTPSGEGVVSSSPGAAAPSPAPSRRRPALPRRSQAPAPSPEPVPAEEVTPEQDEAQEDLQPEPAPERVTEATVTPIEERHRKAVQALVMHFQRLGVDDRAERLWATGVLSGRGKVESSNELTLAEVRDVVGKVERLKDRGSFDALVNTLDAGDPDA